MNSSDLQNYIDQNRIDATILRLDGHTPTVSDAARELGVKTDQIIKSLVFVLNDVPLLVINNGLARVDRRKLAAFLEVGRKRVKFANPEQVVSMTGFVVGSMPPFGHHTAMRTLVDESVMRRDTIYGGGGDIDAMMRLTPSELIRAANGEIVSISDDS